MTNLLVKSFSLALHAALPDYLNVGLKSNNGQELTFTSLVEQVLNLLVIIVIVAAVIYLILNGLKFVTSGGDASKAQEAQKGITYAIIGIIIAVTAGIMVNFVLEKLNFNTPQDLEDAGDGNTSMLILDYILRKIA